MKLVCCSCDVDFYCFSLDKVMQNREHIGNLRLLHVLTIFAIYCIAAGVNWQT